MLVIQDWVQLKYRLTKKPSYKMMKRIIQENERIAMKASSTHIKMKKDLSVRSNSIECHMVEWIWKMNRYGVFICDDIIQEKARRVQNQCNSTLPPERQTNLVFSKGWLNRFKIRNNFRSHTSHGESADADKEAAEAELPIIRTMLSAFSRKDQFNCDEFGLYYKQAPTRTIGPSSLPGRKNRKERLTFMPCINADGSECIPPLVVGKSNIPKCFDGISPREFGFDYMNSKKAWNNRRIFYNWLCRFDGYIGMTPGRRAILLVDNCSAHGEMNILPPLKHIQVLFFPKNTTSLLQPLDAGVIACVKKRYRRRKIQRAVDLIDLGETKNLYDSDVRIAMRDIYDIWCNLDSSIIRNCWSKTCISE